MQRQSGEVQQTYSPGAFKDTIVEIGKEYSYKTTDCVEIVPLPTWKLGEGLTRVNRLIERKTYWSVAEFLAFDGPEFADAITYALQGRDATEAERYAFSFDGVHARLRMILELDNANRKSGSPIRVMGIRRLRNLWRLELLFKRHNFTLLKSFFESLVRREARRIVHRQITHISTIQNMHSIIERLDTDSGRATG